MHRLSVPSISLTASVNGFLFRHTNGNYKTPKQALPLPSRFSCWCGHVRAVQQRTPDRRTAAGIRSPFCRYRTVRQSCLREKTARDALVKSIGCLLLLVQKVHSKDERGNGLNVFIEHVRTNLVGSIELDARPSPLHRRRGIPLRSTNRTADDLLATC